MTENRNFSMKHIHKNVYRILAKRRLRRIDNVKRRKEKLSNRNIFIAFLNY